MFWVLVEMELGLTDGALVGLLFDCSNAKAVKADGSSVCMHAHPFVTHLQRGWHELLRGIASAHQFG